MIEGVREKIGVFFFEKNSLGTNLMMQALPSMTLSEFAFNAVIYILFAMSPIPPFFLFYKNARMFSLIVQLTSYL